MLSVLQIKTTVESQWSGLDGTRMCSDCWKFGLSRMT